MQEVQREEQYSEMCASSLEDASPVATASKRARQHTIKHIQYYSGTSYASWRSRLVVHVVVAEAICYYA
jgi:hypothetical protein